MFIRMIDDAGVAPLAKEDALTRVERYFEGQEPDAIDVRSYLDTTLRRQARHLWPQGASGTPTMPAPGQSGREVRKGAAQGDVQLTDEEYKKSPQARMTIARQRQAAAARRQQP
jgi:hypothetical protein